jgi:hypothetical protein
VADPQGHVVQFYRDDQELVESVARYLGGAIAGGGVAVVAATPAHQRALAARLAAAGLDAAAAQLSGALVLLDAETAVHRLLVAGRIDREAFGAVAGEPVRAAAATGRPVRVFGEMVDVLWDAGHVTAALELEAAWNELAREVPFSLYCAYDQQRMAAHRDGFAEVLSLHDGTVRPAGGRPDSDAGGRALATRTFPAAAGSPRAARQFVLQTLGEWDRERCADDAALVVTELATNAVMHAGSRFTVSVAASGDRVRVSVGDTSPFAGTGPAMQAAPGHGLALVDAVAAAWDVQPLAGGKAVWAEVRPG